MHIVHIPNPFKKYLMKNVRTPKEHYKDAIYYLNRATKWYSPSSKEALERPLKRLSFEIRLSGVKIKKYKIISRDTNGFCTKVEPFTSCNQWFIGADERTDIDGGNWNYPIIFYVSKERELRVYYFTKPQKFSEEQIKEFAIKQVKYLE